MASCCERPGSGEKRAHHVVFPSAYPSEMPNPYERALLNQVPLFHPPLDRPSNEVNQGLPTSTRRRSVSACGSSGGHRYSAANSPTTYDWKAERWRFPREPAMTLTPSCLAKSVQARWPSLSAAALLTPVNVPGTTETM